MAPTTRTVKEKGPYRESEDHVPSPVDQYGTLDTSGTAGSAHSQVREVSPVFEVADRQAALQAARAVDPDDPTPESSVILPEETRSRDEVIKSLKAKARKVQNEPVNVASGSRTPAQQRAAQKGDSGSADTERSRSQQGAGSAPTTERTERNTGQQTQSSDQKSDQSSDQKSTKGNK